MKILDPDLAEFGYVPGAYVQRCDHCRQYCSGLGREATSCRACAEEKLLEEAATNVLANLKLVAKRLSESLIPEGPDFEARDGWINEGINRSLKVVSSAISSIQKAYGLL